VNPLFRAQVDALFKAAVLQDPAEVAEHLRATRQRGLAGDIERGLALSDGAAHAGRALSRAGSTIARGVGHILAPAHAEGAALMGELGAVGKRLGKPSRLPYVAGALALAPILGGALYNKQQRTEDELMGLQMHPFSKMSSLALFLERKAAVYEKTAASLRDFMPTVRDHAFDSVTSGIWQGLVGGVAKAVLGMVGAGLGSAHNAWIVDPRRKRLYETVLRTDPVIHDALSRNPQAEQVLMEAFSTMVRFAPSLALDVNAVRSFLREAVLGGAAGVNYATIKTLIETEKAHTKPGARS